MVSLPDRGIILKSLSKKTLKGVSKKHNLHS